MIVSRHLKSELLVTKTLPSTLLARRARDLPRMDAFFAVEVCNRLNVMISKTMVDVLNILERQGRIMVADVERSIG